MFNSLKRYLRRRMTPIDEDTAAKYKQNLATIYGLVGWNMFGLIIFMMMKEHFPKNNEAAEYLKILGAREATYIKVQNFTASEIKDIQANLDENELANDTVKSEDNLVNQK